MHKSPKRIFGLLHVQRVVLVWGVLLQRIHQLKKPKQLIIITNKFYSNLRSLRCRMYCAKILVSGKVSLHQMLVVSVQPAREPIATPQKHENMLCTHEILS